MSDTKPYNHLRATWAITKSSLQSMLKSPSAIVFSLAFPLIFILVFGFIGGRSNFKFDIALAPNADTSSAIYKWMAADSNVTIRSGSMDEKNKALLKGNIDAIVDIQPSKDSTAFYNVTIQTSTVSQQNGQLFKGMMKEVVAQISERAMPHLKRFAEFNFPPPVQARVYQTIDFILPGQIGFSMLNVGVFGAAFVFFGLRQTLVLKRYMATPVSKMSIIGGEMISRLLFQLLSASVIILLGRFLFHFTLVHGITTFFEMLFIASIGLMLFMGFGFIVSGMAKTESTIPLFSNIITLPQMLLAGTFFSTEAFPKWLQPISKALPLTYMNEAMRKVAFDGLSLWDVKLQIGVMLLWGLIIYFIAIKTFRWE